MEVIDLTTAPSSSSAVLGAKNIFAKMIFAVNDHTYAVPAGFEYPDVFKRNTQVSSESETDEEDMTPVKFLCISEEISSHPVKLEAESFYVNQTDSHACPEVDNQSDTENDISAIVESVYVKEEINSDLAVNLGHEDTCVVSATSRTRRRRQNKVVNYVEKMSSAETSDHNSDGAPETPPIGDICILCAAKNLCRKRFSLIIHFADLIRSFTGVDILNSHVPPTACTTCFKTLLELWNFKQQILDADRLIKEKFSSQLPNDFNSHSRCWVGNVPRPCVKSSVECDAATGDATLHSTAKIGSKFTKTHGVVALVPIENILELKDGNDDDDLTSGDSLDLPSHTTCTNTGMNLRSEGKGRKMEVEKIVCPVCGKQYSTLRSLKRHEITHKPKTHDCNICGERFHFRLYLRRHMRRHFGEKPFRCLHCPKSFSSRWNLTQHNRVHTKSFPYKCHLCSSAFRFNVTLKQHFRRTHTADQFVRVTLSENSAEVDDATCGEVIDLS